MMNFLAPGALLGLLALALPALLHLRRPPPPTVALGSLRHLPALPHRRVQPWRWHDLRRLALRLALLLFLAVALARPIWRSRPEAAGASPPRWTLVDPAGTLTGTALKRLEARRAAGDVVRQLADGFPRFRSQTLSPESDATPGNLWSLLRELDARLPAGSALTVFSPARLDSLRGDRPTLRHVAEDWLEIPARPRSPVPAPPPGPALRAVIFHTADRAPDARRLAVALRAAAPPDATRPEPVVRVNPGPDELASSVSTPADWVFDLGGVRPEAASEKVVATARNRFRDAGNGAPELGEPGRLVAPELAGRPDVVRLRRRVALEPEPGEAVHWTDGTGRPVLTVTRGGDGFPAGGQRRWRFASRFDPAWNDLPGTTALTETLRAWCFPAGDEPGRPDPRLAGAGQARPRPGAVTSGDSRPAWPWPGQPGSGPDVDLRPWALGLAAAGFVLERGWALHRRRRRQPDAAVSR